MTPGGGISTIVAVHAPLKPAYRILSTAVLLACMWLVLPPSAWAQSTAVPITQAPPRPTSPPEPSEPPPPATEPPAATEPGPATPPASATEAPTRRPAPAPADDDEDEPEAGDAPPSGPPAAATADPRPTRTRRPTRTPRTTATVSPTPPVAGGLRLDLRVDPALPVLRERASFLLELHNLADVDISELTLEVVVPDVLLDYRVEVRVGETAQSGPLVRWYLPELPRESSTSLRITGSVARTAGGQTSLCAILLSAAAPLEHCAIFEVLSSRAASGDAASPTAPQADLPTAEPAGNLIEEAPEALASGWTLLMLGFGILGAWLGLQLRSRRAAAGPGAADSRAGFEADD